MEIREYYGKKIQFKFIGDDLYVNATSLREPKKLDNWKRSPNTKRFLNVAVEYDKIPLDKLTIVEKGRNGGTWLHENIVISFYRYVSDEFSYWCDKQIRNILKHIKNIPTFAGLPTESLTILQTDNETLKQQLEKSQKEVQYLQANINSIEQELNNNQETISNLSETNTIYEKIVNTYNMLTDDKQGITTYMIASHYKVSSQKLNKFLLDQEIICKPNYRYVLTSQYEDKGLVPKWSDVATKFTKLGFNVIHNSIVKYKEKYPERLEEFIIPAL